MLLPSPRAILFDLDGTLADTAPDLALAINKLRATHGLPPSAYEMLRPVASAGARGLIGVAFGLAPGDRDYEKLRVAFLENYKQAIAVDTTLFVGVRSMLDDLRLQGLLWGIVTNKLARFTDLLVPKIGLHDADCVVSGDTTEHSKPHPAPLLEAAKCLALSPQDCWYVGDDLRDIEAGRAAGMSTIAAAWGYCGTTRPVDWKADAMAGTPMELLDLIRQ
jgi:phosphoglycolate phosphatase